MGEPDESIPSLFELRALSDSAKAEQNDDHPIYSHVISAILKAWRAAATKQFVLAVRAHIVVPSLKFNTLFGKITELLPPDMEFTLIRLEQVEKPAVPHECKNATCKIHQCKNGWRRNADVDCFVLQIQPIGLNANSYCMATVNCVQCSSDS
jgi:hypothetical protein